MRIFYGKNSVFHLSEYNNMRYLVLALVVSISFRSVANTGWLYYSTKQGVTMITIGSPYDTATEQKALNTFLDFFLEKVERKNVHLKILILLGRFGVYTPGRNFISVAVDTLARRDSIYIDSSKIERYKEFMFGGDYPDMITDSIYSKSINEVGLKIRYYGEFDSTTNYFDRLLSISNYALSNIEVIQKEQQFLRMPYSTRDMQISILSYDTAQLNAVKIEKYGFDQIPDRPVRNIFKITIILASVLVVMFGFFGIWSKHYPLPNDQ